VDALGPCVGYFARGLRRVQGGLARVTHLSLVERIIHVASNRADAVRCSTPSWAPGQSS